MKYSDRFLDILVENGYTTVFYVAGGNIMHILNSCRTRLKCIPVVHEVSAVIAAEYFNETSKERAFALVTAGPGLTNCVTGIAGAWLESRGVLIVGGQVKSTDLVGLSGVRQNGIQELNGIEIVRSICKEVVRLDSVRSETEILYYLDKVFSGRPGPVFMEFCLDVQAIEGVEFKSDHITRFSTDRPIIDLKILSEELQRRVGASERPVILLGGGVSREQAPIYIEVIEKLGIPIMTTWNGADRITSDHTLYFGRPNTWGQRSSNIILQQSDLLIAVGTRLGLQQTGFNWQQFLTNGKVVQVDIDKSELEKSHPDVDLRVHADSKDFLEALSSIEVSSANKFQNWLSFAREVRALCPLSEPVNVAFPDSVNPYDFVLELSRKCPEKAVIIPCSSGGAFTTMMQSFEQKKDQLIVTNKGLASMGYGLAGAIGAAIANPDKPIILVEGDGGFAQNLQELGTSISQGLSLKIFIYSNEGYASIRMTQRNYFDGAYMGCDISTGLGLPDWEHIAKAYGCTFSVLNLDYMASEEFHAELLDDICRLYIVPIDPEQTYFPKISSSLGVNGQMLSDPLHLMTPQLPESISKRIFRYI
jgi:acetolactate synthase-1/2/3 large subunit